ncbi:hypothetical protein K443DRAFT_102980 [Laccaria amethystina LaAM-08-1]|uniref:Uncharacterized protein n=1 Tax=Laccaria amethystina LaAM-08-1 TaxID=1095629 RepID=A0A0C9WND2_9AGAR|nr:hypothetical protein K443DRAFT_102980 [Laccaria amethystina LaAM-08-1]
MGYGVQIPAHQLGGPKKTWDFRGYGLSEAWVTGVSTVIRMMGLDPERAMPREMEVLDRRFFCGGCLEGMDGDQGVDEGQRVLTWTECIAHQMEMYQRQNPHHQDSESWILLSPEAEAYVRSWEIPHPSSSDKIWSCRHCGVHCHNFVRRNTVVQHVKKVHSISSPIESTDIFAYPGPNVDRSPPQPVRIQSENLGVGFQCLKCRKDKYKLWAKNEAIVRHLSDKYV